MIDWKEMSGLHVISKLEEILNKWFGVEIFYTDNNYKIRSQQLDKSYNFKNLFASNQFKMAYGSEYIEQDIEKATDHFYTTNDNTLVMDTFFKTIKGVSSVITIDSENHGTVFAYPFISADTSESDINELKSKLKESGQSDDDINRSISSLKTLTSSEIEYLTELVNLVSDEIVTYYKEISKREERIHELNSELGDKYRYHSMIGKSKKMQQIYSLLVKIKNSESSVFIQGSNGTGKELVAKAVHFDSPRKNGMFLAVNCSAFNDNLLDSELFGHVKGAFTGAVKDKKGLFEMADKGTLFLDEIGDTSLSMQVKLLRVLQEGTYLPVGAMVPQKADVRIIAATNKNLKEMMISGEFREDLFFRINVININLPNLKDRNEDIPLLAEHFLSKRCAESGQPTKILSKKCLEKMFNYPWPGNVRELENEIERLVVLSGDEKTITPESLSPRISEHGDNTGGISRGINTNGNLKKALEELEKIMIREGLKRCNFNKSKLSKELGVSRASLIMKVEKYGLDKRKKAANEE